MKVVFFKIYIYNIYSGFQAILYVAVLVAWLVEIL